MSSVDPRKGLMAVSEQIADVDERRAELIAERDILMVAARDNGATWKELQELTGLSVMAVKKSFDRARTNE